MSRSLTPPAVERAVANGTIELLDLRTRLERRLTGAPAGSRKVSLLRHLLAPGGAGTVYLCAHAVRSKFTLRRGAAEVEGGFRNWKNRGTPYALPKQGILRRPSTTKRCCALAQAKAAAEAASNLITGPVVTGYGDRDGDRVGQVEG